MPISLSKLESHVRALGWDYEVREERDQIALGFPTRFYVDAEGDNFAALFIDRVMDGQYVQVVMPRAYSLQDCKYKAAVLSVLTQIAFLTRSLQCEYDPEDGEVRYAVDSWVLDNTLTQSQLDVMVRIIIELLEEYDPVVRHAMETGRVDLSMANKPEPVPEAPAALPPEISALLEKAGGIEGLRDAVERSERTKKKRAKK